MLINRLLKKVRESPHQKGEGPAVTKRVVRANIRVEGKTVQGVVAVILQPMIGAAALTRPPAQAAPLPPPPLLLPPLVVHHGLLPLDERGGVAGPPHTNHAGVVVATAHTDAAVTVMTKVEIGGGVQSETETNESEVTLEIERAAGAGPDLEIEAGIGVGSGAGAETEIGTRIRTGKEIGSIEIVVTVGAANTRKPPARRGRGGERGAIVMRKTRRKRTRTEKKNLTKKGRKLRAKRRINPALWLQKKMESPSEKKTVTPPQTLIMTATQSRTVKAKRALQNPARDAQILTQVGHLLLRLAKKRNQRNPNVVVQGLRKNLTSLVRRQAANTSLSHDQGSIRFSFLCLYYCFNVIT